jgi:ABC-type branched-subunit amino acid transport system ATPase component
MLLDEPTQGMGHEDVHRVTELIKRVSAGRTILMVEHNMNVVSSIADRITVLQRGAIIATALRRSGPEPAGHRGLHGNQRRGTAGSPLMAQTLEITDLHAWYGESHVLHGVNLAVKEGEVVALLGRNGAAAPPPCAPSLV